MPVPIEFVVTGKPSSVNSTSAKKNAWKTTVKAEANCALSSKFRGLSVPQPYAGDMTVKLFFFPHTKQYLDVDNGIKHTLDAMSPPIIKNDRSVKRLIAERIPSVPGASVIAPSQLASTLRKAFDIATGVRGARSHATAIKIEVHVNDNGAKW